MNLEMEISWQAWRFVHREVQISADAALSEPGGPDLVAGAALC